jgi:D-beta-D-heptose 7-phosphate kinase/D-beta-D-heptose 1-phosphate adenosyltransferase
MKRVIVNGTFDILHPGHIELLDFAKTQGDYLLVAIDTDQRIKQLKGSSRPINNETDRQTMLLSLKSVDDVVLFNSDEELIELVSTCDVMVKGSDYRDKPVIGEALVEVIFYDRTEHSTTKIIQDIIDRG